MVLQVERSQIEEAARLAAEASNRAATHLTHALENGSISALAGALESTRGVGDVQTLRKRVIVAHAELLEKEQSSDLQTAQVCVRSR